jgi:hypothetical protein
MRAATVLALSVILAGFAVYADEAAVRAELDVQYKKLAEAHDRRDIAAILALKTPDFHSIFPDGKVGDSQSTEEYSRRFLANQKLTVSENERIAVAEVSQEISRHRELAGQRRKVDTSVLQRETWAKTAQGWKLKCVDNVHDQKSFVDGKRVDPTKPYDPDAPPYEP